MSTLSKIVRSYFRSGVDDRRSSRIERSVPLVIVGKDVGGQLFREETFAVSLNLHGCRYSSRHECAIASWISVQVKGTNGRAPARAVRARVCSVFSPQTRRELRQVGVEFETAGNVWSIEAPPNDWQYLLGGVPATTPSDAAVAPAREPAEIPLFLQQAKVAAPEPRAEVRVFPAPTADPLMPEPERETAPGKAERVYAPMDQLLITRQEELQLLADQVIENAMTSKLDEHVRKAVEKIDEAWRTTIRKAEEDSVARIGGLQRRAEEMAQRLELLNSNARHKLSQMQKFVECVTRELEPQLYARLDAAFAHASKEIGHVADRVSERQFDYFSLGTQAVLQEALSQLDARLAAARPLFESAPNALSSKHLEDLKQSMKEETLGCVTASREEMRGNWEEQQELQRNRLEEMEQKLEKLAGNSVPDSNYRRKVAENGLHELELRISAKLEESVSRAAQDFEAAAARVCDRQLVRLMDEKQRIARQASLEIEAGATEVRALLQKTANVTLDEFRRRVGVHVDLTTSEATQSIASALASLDAENRVACDARRRTLESDVANAAEKSTQEFRSGIKAFLYSCLVAAVSAVDEHAQTTLNELGKNAVTPPNQLMPSSEPFGKSE